MKKVILSIVVFGFVGLVCGSARVHDGDVTVVVDPFIS